MFHTRPISKVTATFRDIVFALNSLIVYHCLIASYSFVKVNETAN